MPLKTTVTIINGLHTLAGKHSEADASDGASVLDECQRLVLWVKHQPGDVFLGHPGQLMREDVLESNQPQHRLLGDFLRQRIGHAVELDHAFLLLQLGSLVTWRVLRQNGLQYSA